MTAALDPAKTPFIVRKRPHASTNASVLSSDFTAFDFDPSQPRDAEGKWTRGLRRLLGVRDKVIPKPDRTLKPLKIYEAHRWMNKHHPNVKSSQRDEIRAYTGTGHQLLNEALRERKSGVRDSQAVKAIRSLMKPSDRDTLLIRGTNLGSFGLDLNDLDGIRDRVGRTFTDRGFTSTTITKKALEELDHDVILEIEAPKGTRMLFARRWAVTPEENEMILDPGTRFQLLEVRDPGPDDLPYTQAVLRVRIVKQGVT